MQTQLVAGTDAASPQNWARVQQQVISSDRKAAHQS